MTGPFVTLTRQDGSRIVVNAANITTILSSSDTTTAVNMVGETGPIQVTETEEQIVRTINEIQMAEAYTTTVRTQGPSDR